MHTLGWYSLGPILLWLALLGKTTDVMASSSDEVFKSHSCVSRTKQVFEEPESDNASNKVIGIIRYHYDEALSSCEYVLLLGVGTFMSVTDYDNLSRAITNDQSVVVVIMDHNVYKIDKTSHTKYASLANEVVYQLNTLIPICELGSAHILFGGHSASGQAAMQAWRHRLFDTSKFDPLGFIGLDPYEISEKTMDHIIIFDLPGLYWGFTKTTCLVAVQKAAKAAYDITMTSARVLYSIHNEKENRKMTHCVFTDQGCGIHPLSCGTSISFHWVHEKVAESVRIYLQALSNALPFSHDSFKLHAPHLDEIDILVNHDR